MKIVWNNAKEVTEENKPQNDTILLGIYRDGGITVNFINKDTSIDYYHTLLAYAIIPSNDIELRNEILFEQSGLNKIISEENLNDMTGIDFAKAMHKAFMLGLNSK